ncbi:alpha,Alpha-Phosphotrehalase [Arthrobacter sp. Hiyo4]|nr:alpha,Alpha-Phosphotrehalase [Arthrobacter sp. Hiyo4]
MYEQNTNNVMSIGASTDGSPRPEWLADAVIYEIYPQSFADSNGDGIGADKATEGSEGGLRLMFHPSVHPSIRSMKPVERRAFRGLQMLDLPERLESEESP